MSLIPRRTVRELSFDTLILFVIELVSIRTLMHS